MSAKILIVDDDPDVVLFLSTVLQDHGYDTIEAANGREGLQKARELRPDLILLDLMMPQKSGISLLADLGSEATLRDIPVVMVTGVSSETGIDLRAFLDRSAQEGQGRSSLKGYLEKPVDPQKLLNLIRDILT
jgi:CheY-like chemotaxis protein